MVLSSSGCACEASNQPGPNSLSSVRIRKAVTQGANMKGVTPIDLHSIDGNTGSQGLANA